MSQKLRSIFQTLPSHEQCPTPTPNFTTDQADEMATVRFNSPTHSQFLRLRENLFFDQVFTTPYSEAHYPSPLGVVRDILVSFFGQFQINIEPSIISTPVDLEPYPSGTPDGIDVSVADNSQAAPAPEADASHTTATTSVEETYRAPDFGPSLFAAGFEDPSQIMPLDCRHQISHHRNLLEMLKLWYASPNPALTVLYIADQRAYYKFLSGDNWILRSTLQDLTDKYNFLVIDNQYDLVMPDVNQTYQKALNYHFLLAAPKVLPYVEIREDQSIEEVRDYLMYYNIHTGKRKGAIHEEDSRAQKRTAHPHSNADGSVSMRNPGGQDTTRTSTAASPSEEEL
ncbi:uncharacterized protein N7459_010104 [Penicillium hispanicum]|uniref:uncharacterized protein n=1 Tax=Penicillium hispanicum TaxID=1080232 RepID=UPI00253FB14D|nr:uncharacterized protein N7459_010104 [Penicillium hispanicum]KAJ5566722.1 hypothetical protein N7459_010104 [Penicillium hispanicum]